MASITELLDKLKNARATVELVEACGKRVCSSEEHWDCPYGNEGMTDCVDRLEVAYEDTIENLLQLAQALSSADVAPVAHGRWIPVAERMPERDVPVLGWYKDNPFSAYCSEVVAWNGSGWVFIYAHRYVTDVTHWMQLPEPPEMA